MAQQNTETSETTVDTTATAEDVQFAATTADALSDAEAEGVAGGGIVSEVMDACKEAYRGIFEGYNCDK